MDSCALVQTESGQPYTGRVVLSLARVTPPQSPSAYIQTHTLIRIDKGKVGPGIVVEGKVGPRIVVEAVPPDTQLDAYAPFAATAGVYKRDEPVAVIKGGKQALQLIVGKSVQ